MYANPEQAFGGTARLLGLIETIYSAVQQPELWPAVMEGIAEAVHGESTTMFAMLPSEQLFSMARTDPAAMQQYVSHYASINVLSHHCDEAFPDGTVRYGHIAMPARELEKTEFYSDFFRPYNMHHSFGIKVPLGNLPPVYMSCQRPRTAEPFSEREGVVYETLMPHLQRALMLYVQFTQTQSKVLGLESALDSLGHAVFGLDRKGRVILSNRKAEAIVQAATALRLDRGRLAAVFPEQNRHLQKCLSDALAVGTGTGMSPGSPLLLYGKSRKSPLRIVAAPFMSPLPGSTVQLAALVFVTDPASSPPSRSAILTALYALTPMEARVADQLLAGLEVREAANSLGISLETARFHTKRVLVKTGTRRQTELMRLMLSLPRI
ncbi:MULTISPECIES: helix-turn-helix transcriptional regulator [Acidobacterium]|uniref:HTH luxR-type domain-containing protein n=1 Tax=Acidobacterium capsulatum (strain ATCC 51196 / DSM 11244 / BCRC 80197 / JCM 7670 / NBRC 15755 / NCIMB 13165 / 161) TaxID=240015 RepID=C1F7C4_ACIC5|nr:MULTISPECIES: helix-turn-helix transcriptional regulator [Acidobacterium]ACO34642.1 conserved hypothetical protein [Acidobacterium capsulatum ATCC 51196]HCT61056.1 LuxR family transcriptional regulator [Acidobacterium sp.]